MTTAASEASLALSFFGALEGEMYDAYIKAAKNPTISEKYAFFHTTDAACASGFGSPSTGVALSRRFDESPLAYSGAASEDEIVAWAKGASVPRLITFSEDYIEPIFGDRNSAMILFTEATGTAYQAAYEQASKDLQGEILFVTSGVSEGIQSRLAEFIGVTSADMPTLRLISPEESMLKFVWEGDVNALTGGDVANFVS